MQIEIPQTVVDEVRRQITLQSGIAPDEGQLQAFIEHFAVELLASRTDRQVEFEWVEFCQHVDDTFEH